MTKQCEFNYNHECCFCNEHDINEQKARREYERAERAKEYYYTRKYGKGSY